MKDSRMILKRHISVASLRRRRSLPALLTLATCFLAAGNALGQSALHYQGGVSHPVSVDGSKLLVVTDGSVTAVELAIDLASKQLATSVSASGDGGNVFEVTVGAVTNQNIAALQNVPGVSSVSKILRFREGGEAFGITGDVVVKLSDSATPGQFETRYNLRLKQQDTQALGLANVFVFEALGGDSLDRVAAIQSDPDAAGWNAHADLIPPFLIKQQAPQDDLFKEQWHLENRGQFGGAENADIEVLEAWETTLGGGIRIGMFDTGCDIFHEDLSSNYLGVSQNNYGGGGEIFPFGGHGTAVMGLMVGAANSIGVRGVAPEARFTASSFGGSFVTIAASYTFAMQNGVDVHNNSWGLPLGLIPDVISDAIELAADEGRDGRGMVIVFASGNEGRQLQPGDDLSTLPDVIQVGATGQTDVIASYSNFGETQDIMGPTLGDDGRGLVTTDITGADGFNNGSGFGDIPGQPNYTRNMSGTSGASPVVAGVAALVLAENPNLNRHQVRELLLHTTDLAAPEDADYGESTGFSQRYAYGRVNAKKAVEAATMSRNGNLAWPGIPMDITARTVEPDEGDVELVVNLSWIPAGMGAVLDGEVDPGDGEGDGEEDEEDGETEEFEVLILYRDPSSTEFDDGISFAPEDGETYDPGDLDDFDDGQRPDIFDPDTIVIFQGPGERDGRRRKIENLGITGDEGDDQRFAIYAVNRQGRYSFGALFNEEGDIIGGPGGGNVIVPPPDVGRPIDPELTPIEPGKDEPPSVAATADRMLGFAPLTVEFHANAVTPNAVEDRGWSFGDGSTSPEQSILHTYQQPGTYNAVYFAQDERGDVSTRLIRIEALGPDGTSGTSPTTPVSAIIDFRVVAGSPSDPRRLVQFSVDTTGLGESGDDTRVEYFWDFGDGNTGEGQFSENIYSGPGFYSVVVQVTETTLTGTLVRQVSDSTFVEVDSISSSNQPPPNVQTGGTVEADDGNSCGMLGPAMIMLTFAGLVGLRFRRRRSWLA